MTHWLIGVTLAILALGSTPANANVFQQTFKQLHQEPPLPTNQNRADVVQTLWIEQKLDHFNDADKRSWKMVMTQWLYNKLKAGKVNLNIVNYSDRRQSYVLVKKK